MEIVPVILVMNDEYFLPYSLASIAPWFRKFVIYNVGSTDGTWNIIDWFVESRKKTCTFVVRDLPLVSPEIQGIFRNSMIAEAQSDQYFIVDGDEVYNTEDMELLVKSKANKPYGIVKRTEICADLRSKYEITRSHHRLYHRTAIWKGTHPGEEAVIPQIPENEYWIDGVMCYHFHNAIRSSNSATEVPGRVKRLTKPTYRPGSVIPFDLLQTVPILRKPIHTFPVNPELEKLQKEWV